MRFIPESSNRQDWPRLVAKALNETQRKVEALTGSGATGSSAFTLDDGTSTTDGAFVINDGGA